MKKLICLILLLSLCLMVVGCGESDPAPTFTRLIGKNGTAKPTVEGTEPAPTEKPAVFDPQEMSAMCLAAISAAANEEELKPLLTIDSRERIPGLLTYYGSQERDVITEYKLSTGGYDIFYYEMHDSGSGEPFERGYCLLVPQDDHYVLCANAEVQMEVLDPYFCKTCDHTGTVYTGNRTACAICGGTGWQYLPNAYFDPVMNMWMGQNVGCGGCGGSGYVSGQSASICPSCNGHGLIFQ